MEDALLLDKKNVGVGKSVSREQILSFERWIASHPDAFFGDTENCPLKNSFCEGMYVREILIPAGTYYTGAIHKHSHPRFLMQGELVVATEEGVKNYKAPMSMITVEGTKRAGFAKTDCIIVTVHLNPTNTTDIAELRKELVVDDYKELDEQLSKNKLLKNKNVAPNCGIVALSKMCELENSSVATLISLAKDNGITLTAYQVPVDELKEVPLPAIFHSKNHFTYAWKMDSLPELEYSGVVLSAKNLDFERVGGSGLCSITGKSFVAAGIGLISAVGGFIASSKTASAAKSAAGANAAAQTAAANAQLQAQMDSDKTALQIAQVQATAQASTSTKILKWVGIGLSIVAVFGLIIWISSGNKSDAALPNTGKPSGIKTGGAK